MPDGDGYIAAAYLIFLALLLIYFSIMATRLGRLERELAELNELAAEREAEQRAAERPADRVESTA